MIDTRGIGQEVEAGDELLVEDGDFTVEGGAAGWELGDGTGDVGKTTSTGRSSDSAWPATSSRRR